MGSTVVEGTVELWYIVEDEVDEVDELAFMGVGDTPAT